MTTFSPYDELVERNTWLIRLRWIAIIGVTLVIFFTKQVLKIPLVTFPLYAVGVLVGIYNLFFLIYLNQTNKKTSADLPFILNKIANAQISLDLLSLVTLIHFSGGLENPFVFYFIFHVIIASILLSKRAAYLQATFAVFLFSFMAMLEYLGILHHYHLGGFIAHNLFNNPVYVVGVSFVFISTLYIAAYMATSISGRLREKEESLAQLNKLLVKKDHIKSEYVLRVTHDIKEHLAAIQGCIEPVTAGITGSLNEKQMNLLLRADERTGKLLFFVQALLEITRIKLNENIKMEYFSFKDMLSESIAHFSLRAKDKDITINSLIEPGVDRIRGAKDYIQEAVSNILANSIKYTPPNGKIDINVSDKGNSVLIQIKDTGIGIPQNELPKIFDEFYRASNAKEVERDGTGLGLSIARQVIERHNGKIWAESEEGKGSTFSIILPK